ncbi:SAM-dependent methyltransferase [Micromonospora sp. NPDC048871]|uniref:SAM-dependent methyltransferase n=1 Tax=unclassified Micromonospora TaxID=2617518 RepID=UPI002E0DCB4B|nr:SAM-dependent methyltransferase [Micromonospora sp. NBC_01739]
MQRALYGPDGFFVSGAGPAAHFRTSVHASPVFAGALLRLIRHLDGVLGHPAVFDVVDVGAGRGELVRALSVGVSGEPTRAGIKPDRPERVGSPETLTTTTTVRPSPLNPSKITTGYGGDSCASDLSGGGSVPLVERVRFTAVELAPRPDDLPEQIRWTDRIPAGITGLLLATEWLDNVPLDLAVHTGTGWHYLLVDPTSGEETIGTPLSRADLDWLSTWWPSPLAATTQPAPTDRQSANPVTDPSSPPATAPDPDSSTGSGFRAARPAQGSSLTARSRSGCPETQTDRTPTDRARVEIGRTRDEAWADAVGHVERGLALAVDYGHLRATRPVDGTLTGYRAGRQVPPVPDGSCDVTAHVAMDSVASAGERVARCAYALGSQRDGLRALGADGGRPPLSLAAHDPAGYVRALAAASAAAELTDPAGLGGHWWLWQPVGLPTDRLLPGVFGPIDTAAPS